MLESPAAAGTTAVVEVAGAVPTLLTLTCSWSAPVSRESVCPSAAPAMLPSLRFVSPATAPATSLVLTCRQQASSAAPCAALSTVVVRAGPEIHVPFHSLGLK